MTAAPIQSQDFRLAECKHERLRKALEFRPVGTGRAAFSTPLPELVSSSATSLQIVTQQVRQETLSAREERRTLFGALGIFSLACGWFLCGSVASIDLSSFESDSFSQSVSQTIVSPA